ncbi:zinc ribbon domain-containing protein [Fluviicola sp.]|uniref:zinc ribbon domain-containing protein n=1 Tax=Fluviicola sp. TaxID=1917219 RepID=UPI0031DF6FE9
MNITECPNPSCQKPLKETSLFCGKCKTQVKCLDCREPLSVEDECCEACGKDVSRKSSSNGAINKLRIQETVDGRSIEAEFTDPAAKGLMDTLGNFLVAKQLSLNTTNIQDISKFDNISTNSHENIEAQIIAETVVTSTLQNTNYPTIESVMMKNLPSSETEWITIYSFYTSNFGKDIFTRQDIINCYQQTKRKTPQRIKNLSGNIKTVVTANYINPLSDNQFSILDPGIEKAKEILSRTSGSPAKISKTTKTVKEGVTKSTNSSPSKKGTSKGKSQPLTLDKTINFHPKGSESLKDFYAKVEANSNFEKNLVFIHYLKEVLKTTDVGLNQIYTCYKQVNERVPGNLYQSLVDTSQRKGWIDTSDLSKISITVPGENYFEHDLKRK